jgi:chemosensory pili system protein ChpA (sensor histidine kinase/response regulator)
MGFSIDEVRETFTADVSRLIGRIHSVAESLIAVAPALAEATSASEGRPAFTVLGECGHALAGTTALVSATSLSDSARFLEGAAHEGEESLRQMAYHAGRARRLARICAEGADQMRQMLVLELEKRSEEALQLARSWRAAVEPAVEGEGAPVAAVAPPPPSVPPPSLEQEEPASPLESVGEFDFGAEEGTRTDINATAARLAELRSFSSPTSAPAAPAPSEEEFSFEESVGPGFDDELLQVFREEAQATLGALASKLRYLRQAPQDLTVTAEVERLYHTLKGAAATVGLREVSEAAARIGERLDAVLEEKAPASPELIDLTVIETNAMLTLARLGPLPGTGPAAQGSPGQGADGALREAARLFVEEGRELHGEICALLRTFPVAPAADLPRLRGELARLFHRLKGSALIVRQPAVAEAAERLQRRLEAPGGPGPDELALEATAALTPLEGFLAEAESRLSQLHEVSVAERPRLREAVQVETEGELWEAFQLECNEVLEGLEREVLALEESTQPKTNLATLMRLVHTLKGVVNTVGLAPTGKLLHVVEDFLETLLAAPIVPPMRKVAGLLHEVRDAVRRNFKEAREGSVELFLPGIQARIARVLGERGGESSVLASAAHADDGASIHSLDSARSRRSIRSGDSPRERGAEASGDDRAERRFIRVATERLDNLMNLAGELVVSRSRLMARAASLREIQRELGRGSRRLLESVESFREQHEFANLDGRRVRRAAAGGKATAVAAPSAWSGFGELELDRYEDVHILSRSLTEITSDVDAVNGQLARGLASLSDDSDSFDKLVTGIQSEVTRARMVPLEVLFNRLKFPVRDAANREVKEVRVATEGADVALDKAIADALLQPMLHLVRNAVGHGIERPAAREAAGKPRSGTVTLVARQQAGQIGIEVRDDGEGLDLEALRRRGLAMGLIAADLPVTDPAIRELVFAPGLSTRAEVGALAGRGVGCDVVRRAVERLGGSIRVESEARRGTVFLITLPVSLAITKALLVRAQDRSYAIPLHFAERILDAGEAAFVESAGVRRVRVGDQLVPVSTFAQHFGDKRASAGRAVLLLRLGDYRMALAVDAVTGQEEVVVKSLGPFLTGHPLFAGVTIRGSGELVLILDVAGLLQRGARAAQPARPRRLPAPLPEPVREPEEGQQRPEALTGLGADPPAPAPAERLRVLFIDDSLSVRKFAEMTLRALGVEVTLAIDGVDGMNKIRDGHFDLVFTDLEMPRMHGFELIGELRFLPAYRDLPIVVVTSRSGQKHQQQARSLGATDYLTKPFNAQMLDAALKRWGTRRRAGKPQETDGTP